MSLASTLPSSGSLAELDLTAIRTLEAASAGGDLHADAVLRDIVSRSRAAAGTAGRQPDNLVSTREEFGRMGASQDPSVWRLLGKLRLAGLGMPADLKAGRYWLERAANAGDTPAMVALSGFLLTVAIDDNEAGDPVAEDLHFEARFWFASAVLNGDAVAAAHVPAMLRASDSEMWCRAVRAAISNLPRVQ